MAAELQLQLTKFAGPLDLLLHLIKTQEIDIYDIPIAQITDQYLTYLNEMEQLALDVAGEYLVMASTLMAIKSRLLLPQSKVEQLDQGNVEPEDPRQALVDQLLAYQTYQEVSHYLGQKAQQRARYFSKEMSALPKQPVQPLPKDLVTTTEMAAALAHLLNQQAQDQAFVNQTIDRDVFSIEEAQDWVKQQVLAADTQQLKFTALLQIPVSREQVIILFLACLELMKNKVITCFQATKDDEILVSGGGSRLIQYQGEIESILYTLGDEGISLKNLAAILGIHVSALRQLLAELTEFYESHDGGLTLIHHHDTYQLATKPKFAPILHQYFSEHQPTSLSQAALETMAIVAYQQPVTRIEIDQIRGVHSSGALQTLVARQMIQETGRKEVAGRPILYGTTDYFLNYFGLDSLDELPELTEFNAGQYDASGNLDLFFKDRQPETTEEEELIDETDTD